MDENAVWEAVDRRRAALVDLLGTLGPDDWQRDSLCDGWTIHDVAAHLTMPSLGWSAILTMALRHPGGTNTLIREGSKDLARRHPPEEIIETLRRMDGLRHHFPTLTCREALIDNVGHSLDIAIPLSAPLADNLPTDEVAEATERVASYRGRGNAKVFRHLDLLGVRLVATDHEWTTGDGAPATGTMTDLFLVMTGRAVRLDRLQGPGADLLRTRARDSLSR